MKTAKKSSLYTWIYFALQWYIDHISWSGLTDKISKKRKHTNHFKYLRRTSEHQASELACSNYINEFTDLPIVSNQTKIHYLYTHANLLAQGSCKARYSPLSLSSSEENSSFQSVQCEGSMLQVRYRSTERSKDHSSAKK